MKEVHFEFKFVDGKVKVYKDGVYQFTARNQKEAIQKIIEREE